MASWRIYQVDECTNLTGARFIATGEAKSLSGVSLFQFILSWLYRTTSRAGDLFASARFLMLEIFWLNVVLIALATGERLFSARGAVVLLGAATLAPVWDYGFEIRHDNLLLTGLLVIWCVIRTHPMGLKSYLVAGAVTVAVQFFAFKSVVYTVPVTLAILAFPPPAFPFPRWKLFLAWVVGALTVFLAVRFAYNSVGLWGNFRSTTQGAVAIVSSPGIRFWPGWTLTRLLSQTPLLLAVVAIGVLALCAEIWHRGKKGLTWDNALPEAVMLAIAFAGILVNPNPYPYNLLNLVPYAFVFASKHAFVLWNRFSAHSAALQIVVVIMVFTHLGPFSIATRRHMDWRNTRQEQLMRCAEDLTDPLKDPVFDGSGLVPTRPSISPWSFIHSLTIHRLTEGPGPKIREMLAENPAPVLIQSYRTDSLPEQDHAFIREHYVSLADDFWVLGKVLPAGGGTFEVIHPGRYRIASIKGSDIAGTYPKPKGLLQALKEMKEKGTPEQEDPGTFSGTIDGAPIPAMPMELSKGIHRIEATADCQPTVVWTGPKRPRPSRLSQSDHRDLFVNWY